MSVFGWLCISRKSPAAYMRCLLSACRLRKAWMQVRLVSLTHAGSRNNASLHRVSVEAQWKRHGVWPSVAIKMCWSACITFLALSLLRCYLLSMVSASCSNEGIEPSVSAPWIYASSVVNNYDNIREVSISSISSACV